MSVRLRYRHNYHYVQDIHKLFIFWVIIRAITSYVAFLVGGDNPVGGGGANVGTFISEHERIESRLGGGGAMRSIIF